MVKDLFRRLFGSPQESDDNEPVPAIRFDSPAKDGRIDPHSNTWIAVEGWLNTRIAELREDNDSPKRDALQTAVIRGQIRLAKDLLAAPHQKERVRRPPDDDREY
jgi:hypothetical protein